MSDSRNTGSRERTPDQRQLGETAYALIRADIVRCDLEPGMKVTEAYLAARYGLGKAPIRKALAQLTEQRLVRPIARRGFVVAPISIQDLQELFQLRLVLEPLAARSAAGVVDAAQLLELERRASEPFEPEDEGAADRLFAGARAFHLLIAEASGNARLVEIMTRLIDETERAVRTILARGGSVPHGASLKDLVHALLTGDAAAAERLSREHVQEGHAAMVQALIADENGTLVEMPGSGRLRPVPV